MTEQTILYVWNIYIKIIYIFYYCYHN